MDRGNIFSGSSFRATLYGVVAFLAILTLTAVLAILYIERELKTDIQSQLEAAISTIQALHEEQGTDGLRDAMQDISRSFAQSDRIALLYDKDGNRIVGDRHVPLDFEGWVERDVAVASGTEEVAGYYVTAVPIDGHTVVIGRDLGYVRHVEMVTVRAFLVVGALMTFIFILIGYRMSSDSLGKLQAMGNTLQRVAQGETDARLTVAPENNQIDRIAKIMNVHLDTLSELVQSTKMSAAAIAHDLKRPLSRAYLGLESVLDDEQLTDGSRAYIEEIREELAGLTAIFETILRIARIDASYGTELTASFDLGALVADLCETYEVVAEESGQTLVEEIAENAPVMIRGDQGMIGQLVVNLLQNAITHCPVGTFITVGLQNRAGQVVLTVADNGPGIPEAARSKVFDAFFRADTARTTEGSGLGMALAKSIADRHDATIALDDNAPGLRVTVVFPRT